MLLGLGFTLTIPLRLPSGSSSGILGLEFVPTTALGLGAEASCVSDDGVMFSIEVGGQWL
jgi:hypothetical protein